MAGETDGRSSRGSKKKITVRDIYDSLIVELGLTEDEFFRLPPYRTYMMELHNRRKRERMWQHTRFISADLHNTSMKSKGRTRPVDRVRLSLDQEEKDVPGWDPEEAIRMIDIMTKN